MKENIEKMVTLGKLFKNAVQCRQAERCSSIRLDFRAKRVKVFTLNYADKIITNFETKFRRIFFVFSAHISDRSIGKSVTIVKSYKRALNCHQAELTRLNRLDFTSKLVHASLNKKVVKNATEID